MWLLNIQTHDNQEGVASHMSPYPDRPGEPDCIYYLRTGWCGYGRNCRFNHPDSAGEAAQHRGELPERVGQPDCRYFLKTGTCRFGSTCKFHHPRNGHDSGQVSLNILGLPMRQEEKSCPYYMRTGSCKFGIDCKFHHPQPGAFGAVLPVNGPAALGSMGSSAPSSGVPYVGGLPAWSLPRTPYISVPSIQGPQAYMPVVLSPSPGIIPGQQGWNAYKGELGSSGQVHLLSTSVAHVPERLDQKVCHYFVMTGSCKYGTTCKFNHPQEKISPLAISGALGPLGLPLRPGQTICAFYSLYGICNFGPNCKFDHPFTPFTGYSYDYSMSLPPPFIPDPSLYPYQRNSGMAPLSETSPSKPLRLPDRIRKPEAASNKHQNPDTKSPEVLPEQAASPTDTSPISLEPLHEQSD